MRKVETLRLQDCNETHIELEIVDTKQPLVEHGRRCYPQEIENIASQEPIANSNCPDSDEWMRKFLEISQERKGATLISVGCNRGDDLLIRFREWSKNSSYSFLAIQEEYQVIFRSIMRSCKLPAVIDPPVVQPRAAQAFCIEPMISTFDA
jgi:hypothetical protein